MNRQLKYYFQLVFIVMVYSCTSPKYIYDVPSSNRQKELKDTRSGHVIGEILVPIGADYNVYFSKTIQNDDDEFLHINTSELRKIYLKPGITTAIKVHETEQ